MAAPHQNIADILVLKTATNDPDASLPTRDTPDLDPPDLAIGAPVGLKLAAARKAKGLTHLDVHAGTKIKIVHIVAIEAGERAFLPATPFTAGFVKAYAQFLGLSGDEFARAYKREAGFVPPSAQLPTPLPATAPRTAPAEAPMLVMAPQAAAAPSTEAGPAAFQGAAATLRQTIDTNKTVTWIGAGAAIAIVAFLAGRAAQPREATLPVAEPATVVSEVQPTAAPAPEPIAALELPVQAPMAAEPAPAIAAVEPPAVKPKPKKPIVVEAPPPEPTAESPAPIIGSPVAAPAPVEPSAPKIVAASILKSAAPRYPERCAARADETVGVSVIFSITAAGKPVSASVASTENRCFNSAALRAVYDMRFSPRTIDGAPATEAGKTVTVQFVR